MLDILVITETKLDDTFPVSQFQIDGFSKLYLLDRNRNGAGVIINVREDISSKILAKHVLPTDIEELFIELNFRKCKWLLSGIYHPPSQSDQKFFYRLDNALDVYPNYENILLVGDFNAQIRETCLDTFLYQHAGADPAFVIRGGPNSEHFLSNLRKLLKRGKFFLTTQSLIVKRN